MNRYGTVGVAMLLVGLGLFGGGVYFSLQQEQQLSDLQRTNGTVLSATLETVDGGYYPNVTYRYSVGGTNYTSRNIFPAQQRRAMERDDAEEMVGRYSGNQSVTVYYPEGDPGDPSLRAPRSPTPIFAVGFGFVITAFGFLFAVAGRQGGMNPIETDEVTLVDEEPTPKREADGETGEGDDGDG